MGRLLKRRLALGVTLAALLAGGTAVALGATGGGHGHRHGHAHARAEGVLSVAASYLGTSAAQLKAELASGKTLAQVASQTSGRSSAGLVAALVAARQAHLRQLSGRVEQQMSTLVNRRGARLTGASARRAALRSAALSYLGLTREQLVAALHGGKSLAQVADETPGKSSAGLIAAIMSAAAGRLESSAGAAGLSKAAETQRLAKLRTRVTKFVDRPRGGSARLG